MNNEQQTPQTNDAMAAALTPEALLELHKIARRCMSKENQGHTLQATALVNEAYLSLHAAQVNPPNKLQFFALAATHMRHILVDHARSKASQKRQAQALAISANDELLLDTENISSLVLLDEVLLLFSALDERAAKMYEMRLFAGVTNNELAKIFQVSVATVEREIRIAKAWINQQFAS